MAARDDLSIEHDEDRRTRTVNFSDAVVAIAATLLVLPLVELAPEVHVGSLGSFLDEHSDKLLAFVISFAVIVQFQRDHLEAWAPVRHVTAAMHRCNQVWLLGIVFLPFPTQVLAANGIHDPATNALYVGTIVIVGLADLLQQRLAVRATGRRAERSLARVDVTIAVTAKYVVAFAIAVGVPDVGIWALLVLALPVQRPLDALHRRRTGR